MTPPITYAAALDAVTIKALACHSDKASARLVKFAIEEFLRTAAEAALRDGSFVAPELGALYRSVSKERRITHPITKEPLMLPATFSLKLRAAKHRKGVGP